MQVITSARHFELSDALKEYIETKMQKLAEEYNKMTTTRVVLNMEHGEYFAEVIAHGKNIEIEASASSQDMHYSIDLAYEKAEKQLLKQLGRMQDHSQEQKYAESIKDQGALFPETEES